MARPAMWAAIAGLNLALACGAAVLAPAEVGTTADRVGYEYVGQHPLAMDCPYNVFCYRLLVPSVLEPLPLAPTLRWRAFAVVANSATGVLVARSVAGFRAAPMLASILFQTSFGATFAVYDPFTPDPAVFLVGAVLTLAWLANRPLVAVLIGLLGIFAKETVALVLAATGLASLIRRGEAGPRPWLLAAAATWLVLLGFHAAMNVLAGWSETGSGSADLATGAWLGRWLADPTLTFSSRLFYVFVPFGWAWVFALLGFARAPDRLRALALGALVVLPGLVYVQTVERALGTAFFVVVPLAAVFLARLPVALAVGAAVANGLLTARVGLSSAWLPPTPYLLALATIVGTATLVRALAGPPSTGAAAAASSRVSSSR